MNAPVKIMDAQQALGFVTHQRTHIEREVLKKPMPQIQYSSLVPVDTDANPYATSVTFFTQESTGRAKFISGKGDDIPLVGLGMTKFETGLHMGGIGYSFSLEEIGAASQYGIPLNNDGAMAAREAYEQLVDEVAMVGNDQLNVEGLANTTGITSVAASGTIASMTPQEALALINAQIGGILNDSKGIELADTVLLPISVWADIATRQISPESSMTILQFIQQGNVYTARTRRPLNIIASHHLTGKMVVYRKDPGVVKLHMPMPLTFIPPQALGLEIRTFGMFRFSPVNIRRPGAMRYVTGI